jgi:hypothetical protein
MKPIGIEFGERSVKGNASAAALHSGFVDLRSPNQSLQRNAYARPFSVFLGSQLRRG